jgi:hypothetical protein
LPDFSAMEGSATLGERPAVHRQLAPRLPGAALLDNMRWSRSRRGVARTWPKRDIEERLDEMLRRSGEAAVQRHRDEAD